MSMTIFKYSVETGLAAANSRTLAFDTAPETSRALDGEVHTPLQVELMKQQDASEALRGTTTELSAEHQALAAAHAARALELVIRQAKRESKLLELNEYVETFQAEYDAAVSRELASSEELEAAESHLQALLEQKRMFFDTLHNFLDECETRSVESDSDANEVNAQMQKLALAISSVTEPVESGSSELTARLLKLAEASNVLKEKTAIHDEDLEIVRLAKVSLDFVSAKLEALKKQNAHDDKVHALERKQVRKAGAQITDPEQLSGGILRRALRATGLITIGDEL